MPQNRRGSVGLKSWPCRLQGRWLGVALSGTVRPERQALRESHFEYWSNPGPGSRSTETETSAPPAIARRRRTGPPYRFDERSLMRNLLARAFRDRGRDEKDQGLTGI